MQRCRFVTSLLLEVLEIVLLERGVYIYICLRQTNKAESVQPPAVPVWQCYRQAWEQSNRLRCQPCAAKAQQKSLCRQMFGPQGQKHPRPPLPKSACSATGPSAAHTSQATPPRHASTQCNTIPPLWCRHSSAPISPCPALGITPALPLPAQSRGTSSPDQ